MSLSVSKLSASQKAVMDRIVEIGILRGDSSDAIALAIQFANAESTFNPSAVGPTPGTTIMGTFQYSNDTWTSGYNYAKAHDPSNPFLAESASGSRSNLDAQITVMYSDMARYRSEFNSGTYPTAYRQAHRGRVLLYQWDLMFIMTFLFMRICVITLIQRKLAK
jgi:hypothetical protein